MFVGGFWQSHCHMNIKSSHCDWGDRGEILAFVVRLIAQTLNINFLDDFL